MAQDMGNKFLAHYLITYFKREDLLLLIGLGFFFLSSSLILAISKRARVHSSLGVD